MVMKAKLPQPEHYSYNQHRRQRVTQIYLPVIVSTLLMFALIALIISSTFTQGGDVGRWAAISTIWIVIPVMLAGLILLAVLIGLIYLMARALGGLPYYSGIAQDYVYKAQGYITRGAALVVKPVRTLNHWLEQIKVFVERMTP